MGWWDGGLGVERGRTQLTVDIGRHLELAAMGLAKDTLSILWQGIRARSRGSALLVQETSTQLYRSFAYLLVPMCACLHSTNLLRQERLKVDRSRYILDLSRIECMILVSVLAVRPRIVAQLHNMLI